jgi:hypothetical protein
VITVFKQQQLHGTAHTALHDARVAQARHIVVQRMRDEAGCAHAVQAAAHPRCEALQFSQRPPRIPGQTRSRTVACEHAACNTLAQAVILDAVGVAFKKCALAPDAEPGRQRQQERETRNGRDGPAIVEKRGAEKAESVHITRAIACKHEREQCPHRKTCDEQSVDLRSNVVGRLAHARVPVAPASRQKIGLVTAVTGKLHAVNSESCPVQSVADKSHFRRCAGQPVDQQHARASSRQLEV